MFSKLSVVLCVWFAFITHVNAANTQYGPVQRGDSLWSIAKQLKPDDSISVSEMTRLLFKHNPEAFSNNDMGQLKLGAMLYVPGYLPPATGNNSVSSKQRTAKTSGDNAKIRKALRESKAEIKRLKAENKQLKSRLASLSDIDDELQTLRQENSYKDAEIAALRQELNQPNVSNKQNPRADNQTAIADDVYTDVDDHAMTETDTMTERLESSEPSEISETSVATPPSEEDGFNLIMWLGAAGAGLVLIGLVGLILRRKPADDADTADAIVVDKAETAIIDDMSLESVDELLTKADIEFAKQNYQQAKVLVGQAQAMDATRPDTLLRMLEIHHALGDVFEFEMEVEVLPEILPDRTDPIWQQVIAMGKELGSNHALFIDEIETISAVPRVENDFIDDTAMDNAMEDVIEDIAPEEMLPPTEMSDLGFDEMGQLFQEQENDVPNEQEIDALLSDDGSSASMSADDVNDEFERALEQAEGALLNDDNTEFGHDEADTKLELAQAFLDMGDSEQARSILNEVLEDGSSSQQQQANAMIMQL